jgi:hypothetical protein
MIHKPTPVICQHCHKPTGYTKQELSYLVVPPQGLRCTKCDEVFIRRAQREWARAEE